MLTATFGGGDPSRLLFTYSGDPALDAFYQNEGLNLVYTFGISPPGFFYDDAAGPNAFATSEMFIYHPQRPDGTVVLGIRLMIDELRNDGGRGHAVRAILAHEFAHLAQFRAGGTERGKRPELQADFLAGWYTRLVGVPSFELMPVLNAFYSRGDYKFNDPIHHGTPDERLAATSAGYASSATTFNAAWLESVRFVSAL